METSTLPRWIRFGILDVDAESGEQFKNVHRARLQSQPIRVLLVFSADYTSSKQAKGNSIDKRTDICPVPLISVMKAADFREPCSRSLNSVSGGSHA